MPESKPNPNPYNLPVLDFKNDYIRNIGDGFKNKFCLILAVCELFAYLCLFVITCYKTLHTSILQRGVSTIKIIRI